jgi:hypothetical protein
VTREDLLSEADPTKLRLDVSEQRLKEMRDGKLREIPADELSIAVEPGRLRILAPACQKRRPG